MEVHYGNCQEVGRFGRYRNALFRRRMFEMFRVMYDVGQYKVGLYLFGALNKCKCKKK